MDINKIFDGSLDEIANNIFKEVSSTTAEAKAIRQQKIAENTHYIIEAIKKIENDLNSKYEILSNLIEERSFRKDSNVGEVFSQKNNNY